MYKYSGDRGPFLGSQSLIQNLKMSNPIFTIVYVLRNLTVNQESPIEIFDLLLPSSTKILKKSHQCFCVVCNLLYFLRFYSKRDFNESQNTLFLLFVFLLSNNLVLFIHRPLSDFTSQLSVRRKPELNTSVVIYWKYLVSVC